MAAPVTHKLVGLEIEEVSLVSKPANQESKVTLWKSTETPAAKPVQEKRMAEEMKAPESISKADFDAAIKKMTDALAAKDVANEAAIQKMTDALTAKDTANEALRKDLDEEKRVRKVKDAVVRAASVYKHIPAKADELGTALMTLSEKAPEETKVIEAALAKCNEAMGQSPLFKQTSGNGDTAATASDEYDALVAKAMAADKALNVHSAGAKVARENKGLYTRMLAEQAN